MILWRSARIFVLLVVLAAVSFIPAGMAAAVDKGTAALKIIHMNDLHGHIKPEAIKVGTCPVAGGAAYFGAMVLREKSADPDGAVVLSAGDMFQGTPVSNVFRGKPVIEIMNRLGFEAMALGNHEFDWGWPELQKMMSLSRFPYLAANLKTADGADVPGIKKFICLERKGLKIAVIGVASPETAFTTKPKNVKGFKFLSPERVLPPLVRQVRKDGAKLVVVLSHCGFDRDRAIAERVPGVDIIVGGHSHTALTPAFAAGGTIIVQAGSWGHYLGVLDLEVDRGSGRILKYSQDYLRPVPESPGSRPDPGIKGIVQRYERNIRKEFSRVVGETRVDLIRNSAGESNLGNLICDSMRAESGAQIAFYNSGGIRANIFKGKVRLEQAFEALPFDNLLVSMDLTGAQVREILEHSAARGYGILQVSGIKVMARASNPEGSRIEETFVNGQKLEIGRVYRVVTNEFLAAGGDRYLTFKQGRNIVYGDDSREVFIRHMKKNSPVEPRIEGRIVITQ